MFSLVGDYTDSDEDDDTETRTFSPSASNNPRLNSGQPSSVTNLSDSCRTSQDPPEPQGSIIDDDGDYYVNRSSTSTDVKPEHQPIDDSDESDDLDADVSTTPQVEKKSTAEAPLQNPFRSFGASIAEVSKSDSVFQIQFLEDEQQKSAALQKHVKMTSAPGGNAKINGKKVCWNFRKGKCRFGHNCTYGHDSDLLVTKKASGNDTLNKNLFTIQKEPAKIEPQHEFDPSAVITSSKRKETTKSKSSDDEDALEDQRNDNLKGKKKRKRPGLVQNLTPGKKVMNAYYKGKDS